ncbi:MAG TPA: 5'-3' exonuclease H3TH domain-containing protein [Actinomycetota bacterium]|nr:5'-3' exonuclease H3TH domain-containing protein [Actinomycetota bacterium]
MEVHLVDGTYELFRHHFGVPSHRDPQGIEVGAVRGVVRSVLGLLEGGATHVGVATDHVIESFRNEMWPGYKTGEGVEPDLLGQFPILEDALRDLGVTVWAMTEWEADDALASAAAVAGDDPGVKRVLVCTPDKDLAQCVRGDRVVQFDRRKRELRDEEGVVARFGVRPEQIPDYLALVGDTADGFPGIPGFGARTAATVLQAFGRLEDIPYDPAGWAGLPVRSARTAALTLAEQRDLALLFRDLATLRTEPPVVGSVDELRWTGPGPGLAALADRLGDRELVTRAQALARRV